MNSREQMPPQDGSTPPSATAQGAASPLTPTTYSPPPPPARSDAPRAVSRGKRAVRYIVAVVAVLGIVGALIAVKAAQIGSLIRFGAKAAEAGPPPEAVGTHRAEMQDWEGTIDAIGSIASSKGVTVSTEVPGTIKRIAVESGAIVKAGQVLVELDTSVERAQLASALARKDLSTTTVKRTTGLAERGAVTAAQLDSDQAQLKSASADVAALQAQIARKTIRAPFAGKLGIRTVNLGQYINPGTPVAVLESIDSVYVDFTLPQQHLTEVSVGMPVRLAFEADAGPDGERKRVEGTLAAIEPSIDQTTRSVKLRAAVPNQTEKLRPGMFVDVSVVLPKKASQVTVPLTALVRAPYGNSVFIVEDKKPDAPGVRQTPDGKPVRTARQQFVRSGRVRGDFVVILEGVQAGQEVVTTGAFKLRNGAPVYVTDVALNTPKLDPRPDNH